MRGVGAVAHFLAPVDLIPDAIPFAGLLDDASVLALAIAAMHGDLDTFADCEASQSTSK